MDSWTRKQPQIKSTTTFSWERNLSNADEWVPFLFVWDYFFFLSMSKDVRNYFCEMELADELVYGWVEKFLLESIPCSGLVLDCTHIWHYISICHYKKEPVWSWLHARAKLAWIQVNFNFMPVKLATYPVWWYFYAYVVLNL